MQGSLFIISAPSGAGKTSILKRVITDLQAVVFSVSHTTREPRTGEVNGKDYHFVDRETFGRIRDRKAFLEWAEVHGNLYGTSLDAVKEQLSSGEDVILDIDTQGASQVRALTDLTALSIFIAPPSLAELKQRLTGRDTDSAETIRLRLNNASLEMAEAGNYDHYIINDTLDEAVVMVKAVILSERSRSRRDISGNPLT